MASLTLDALYDSLPSVPVARIIWHWTAGAHVPSALDKEHYHFLVDGTGVVIPGRYPVTAIASPLRKGAYAAHTLNANSGSIGCAVCCMFDARESPFSVGPYPLLVAQWNTMVQLSALLCYRYGLSPAPRTLLSHAEVQEVLGIGQRGKWDISVMPRYTDGREGLVRATPREVGDALRKQVMQEIVRLRE